MIKFLQVPSLKIKHFSSSLNNLSNLNTSNFYFKKEFFSYASNCKYIVRKFSTSSFLNLPVLKEQSEKSLIFFHDDLWEEEEKLRSRYCLRILFALKKYQENNPRPTVSNSLLDFNIVCKNIKLILNYLKNSLVTDLDRINSKFLLFFYFLTKINNLSIKNNKQKLILRNLFFSFIFFISRREYFLNLSTANSLISKNYILFKPRIRYVTSIFPQGLFLLLYSPYKSSFNFSSTNLFLSRQFIFTKRLNYVKSLLFNKKNYIQNDNNFRFKISKIPYDQKFSVVNFNSFFSRFKFIKKNYNLKKVNIFFSNLQKSYRKKGHSIFLKKAFIKYHNSIDLFSERNLNKKSFIISSNFISSNYSILLKFLRKFLWRQFNKFKLRIYRLSFYFYRRFPRGTVLRILKIISKFRFFLSEFMGWLSFSSRNLLFTSFNHLNLNLFFSKVFSNFMKVDQSIFFLDSLRVTSSIKIIEKKTFLYNQNDLSNFNNSFILFDKLKTKVIDSSSVFLKLSKIIKVKSQKKFSLLLKLNLISDLYSYTKIFSSRKLQYEIFQTNVAFLIESFKFFNNFRFTLKFLLFSKFSFVKKFVNTFSTFTALLYIIFNSIRPDLIAYNFQFFPLYYYYNRLELFNLLTLNNSLMLNFFNNLLNKYKNFFTNLFMKKTKVMDYDVLKDKSSKKRLMTLKFLRKNSVQKFIIDRQNLRNLESLSDYVKRFVKKLKDVPRSSRSFSFVKYYNTGRKIKKKRYINIVKYVGDGILNSKYTQSKYFLYKLRQKRNRLRRKRYKQQISLLKSHITQNDYFFDSYFYRFYFKKYITRLDFKRQRKRFYINVLFFNKFIKEKRISVLYHRFVKGSNKITVFHKFSNPFFLRLKLKRYFVFGKVRRILNRFSFLTSSINFKLFINKLIYVLFLNTKNFNKILHSSLFSSKFFYLGNFQFKKVEAKEKSVILSWLSSFKIKYFNLIFSSVSFFYFNENLSNYLFILKFLFKNGLLIFIKNFYDFINEIYCFSVFFRSLKNFFINFVSLNLNMFFFIKVASRQQLLLKSTKYRNYSTFLSNTKKKCDVRLISFNIKNKKTFKFKYFFIFNGLNKPIFNLKKCFNFVSISASESNFSFLNFFYSCYFKVYILDFTIKNDYFNFLKFFKNFNQLSLFFYNYAFPIIINKNINNFQQFLVNRNYPLDFSKLLHSPNQILGIGFFTFFYSSFRNFYCSFSRSIYSFILARRLRFKNIKLKKKRLNRGRKKNYYNKYTSPNSVYYLSSRKRIYKGFRLFKPNYPYHRFFSYYISYKLKPKEIRKKMFKNVVFFKLPYKKNYFKSKKFLISSSRTKSKKVKNSQISLKQQTYGIRLYKKNSFNFKTYSSSNKKKVREKFFKLIPKFSTKKNRTALYIHSSSIAFTNSIFKSSIFIENLLKQKINSIFKKFSVHPFKKLFYLNRYFFNSSLVSDKPNLVSKIFIISKNLFLKFYSRNLLNLNLILLNIKLQRFFRLLIYIYNQFSSFLKFSDFHNKSFIFNKHKNAFGCNYLFLLSYYELFFYSDCCFSVQQFDDSIFFYKLINDFEFNNFNFYFFDLMSFFYVESFFYSSNLFLIFLSNNLIFSLDSNFMSTSNRDLFFIDFVKFPQVSSLELVESDHSNNNFLPILSLHNGFFFQYIKFYIYIANFYKLKFFSHKIVPLKFLLSNFQLSFLKYLESFYFIRFIKKNDVTFVILNNSFFDFLNNVIFILLKKYLTFISISGKHFSFVLNIFLSFFDYNLTSSNIIHILFQKFKFPKLSNFKIKTKYSFLKFFLLLKNFNISNFSIKKSLKKRYYMYFKRRTISTKIQNYKRNLKSKSSLNLYNEKKVSFNRNNHLDHSNFIDSLDFSKTQILNFLQTLRIKKFSLSSNWFRDISRKEMRLQRISFGKKPLHYRFLRRLRRRSKKFFFQRFYNYSLDSKIRINELFLTFFLVKKARNINTFLTVKKNIKNLDTLTNSFSKNGEYNFAERNRLEPFFKRLFKRLRFNRVRLNRRHLLMKSKFHPMIKQKIFLGFFLSPRFFNFKNISNFDLFFQHNSSTKLKEKIFLFLRMNRFLEFIIKLILKVKLFIRKNTYSISLINKFYLLDKTFTLSSFANILKIYRKVKLLLKHFFNKLILQVRKKRGFDDNYIINLNLNSNTSTLKFIFFYNFLSLKFFKFFILRYFFFGDYIKLRFQFINRYLWFRTIPLNIFLLTPKIYIIITKVRNNFFITAIDLYGRILYKSSPGMVKFTGSDRMSKYAWFEASVDFFDGFIEFFRYFLKSKKKKKTSYSAIRIDREYSMRFNRTKKKFSAFMNPFSFYSFERRKSKKKTKKRRGKLKIRLRRFFIISKGISDFNLRVFLKGMVSERFYVSKYFAGAVNYPMRSFSLCRIKKVRRV